MSKFDIGIFGSSDVKNPDQITRYLDSKKGKINSINIHHSSGVPEVVIKWCSENRINYCVHFPRNYDQNNNFDKGANFKNLLKIIDHVELWVIFWDYRSRGTKNLIDLIISKQKRYEIIKIND